MIKNKVYGACQHLNLYLYDQLNTRLQEIYKDLWKTEPVKGVCGREVERTDNMTMDKSLLFDNGDGEFHPTAIGSYNKIKVEQECILWVDIETTGLDPNKHTILEVAAVLTTMQGKVLMDTYLPIMPKKNATWSQGALKMHTQQTGLMQDLEKIENVECFARDIGIVGRVIKFISQYDPNEQPYLGGSGPHFDKSFLKDCDLHYRHMDMRSLTKFFEETGVAKVEERRAHRAHIDVVESVLNYRKFVEAVST